MLASGVTNIARWVRRVPAALEVVSLDVAAGVVGAATFVAAVSGAGRLPPAVWVALVAAVLAVYNLDHFLDGARLGAEVSPRRRRYGRHRALLACTTVAAAVAGAVSCAFLPRPVLAGGAVLALVQAGYFLGLRCGLRGPAKRMAAAAGWTAGIALPAWAGGGRGGEILLAAGILAALGWINLQSYALVEAAREDETDSVPGFGLRAAAIALAAISIVLAVARHPEEDPRWAALALVGAVQVALARLPLEAVHPAGEWSFALLGLAALG